MWRRRRQTSERVRLPQAAPPSPLAKGGGRERGVLAAEAAPHPSSPRKRREESPFRGRRMSAFKGRRQPSERGIVLIITVLVLSILLVVGYALAFGAAVNLRLARNGRDEARRECAALSAVNYAAALLTAAGRTAKFDAFTSPWAATTLTVTLDGEAYAVTITDENRKLNVNRAARPPADVATSTDLRPVLKRLIHALDGADTDYDAICGWVDPAAAAPAENAPKKPLLSIGGLYAIPGVSPALLNGDGQRPALVGLLTTHADRINVNTASPEVLSALWEDASLAQQLVARRNATPFTSDDEARQFLDRLHALTYTLGNQPMLTTRSDFFAVRVHPIASAWQDWVALVQRRDTSAVILSMRQTPKEVPQ